MRIGKALKRTVKSITGAVHDAVDTVKGAAHDAVHKAKEAGEDFIECPGLAIGSSVLGYYLGGATGAMVGAQLGGGITQSIQQKQQANEDRALQEEQYAKQEDAARLALESSNRQSIGAGATSTWGGTEDTSDYNDSTRKRRRFSMNSTVNSTNLLGGITGRSVLGG